MEQIKIGQKAHAENIDGVTFGNCVIHTTLSTGFEGGVSDDLRRDVDITFELSDNEHVKKHMLDRIAAAVRITLNNPGGILKGAPTVYDAESYAEFLDENDCKFHLTSEQIQELYTPSSREISEQDQSIKAIRKMEAAGQIPSEKADEMVAIIEATRQDD